MKHIQAAKYTPTRSRQIDLIVVHSAETPERAGAAEAIARFFASLAAGGSAHVSFDRSGGVSSVIDRDVAWGAPGANHNGLHAEFAGHARQGRDVWLSKAGISMLGHGSEWAAEKALAYKIPRRLVSLTELQRGGARGFVDHVTVSRAFRKSDHWDPGTNFPWDKFLPMVDAAMPGARVAPSPYGNEIDEMPLYIKIPAPAHHRYYRPGPERMVEVIPTGAFWLLKTDDGGVGAWDGAPFMGSLPGIAKLFANAIDLCPFVQDGFVLGYWIVTTDGSVYALGEAPYLDNYSGHPEWHANNRYITGIVQTGGFTKGDPVRYRLLGRETSDPDYVVDRYDLPLVK